MQEPNTRVDNCVLKLIGHNFKQQCDKNSRSNFKKWRLHNAHELQAMYNDVINSNLDITYQQFVVLAYECTEPIHKKM